MSISSETREAVWERDGELCQICFERCSWHQWWEGIPNKLYGECHHVFPDDKDAGRDDADRLVLLHKKCHQHGGLVKKHIYRLQELARDRTKKKTEQLHQDIEEGRKRGQRQYRKDLVDYKAKSNGLTPGQVKYRYQKALKEAEKPTNQRRNGAMELWPEKYIQSKE